MQPGQLCPRQILQNRFGLEYYVQHRLFCHARHNIIYSIVVASSHLEISLGYETDGKESINIAISRYLAN